MIFRCQAKHFNRALKYLWSSKLSYENSTKTTHQTAFFPPCHVLLQSYKVGMCPLTDMFCNGVYCKSRLFAPPPAQQPHNRTVSQMVTLTCCPFKFCLFIVRDGQICQWWFLIFPVLSSPQSCISLQLFQSIFSTICTFLHAMSTKGTHFISYFCS